MLTSAEFSILALACPIPPLIAGTRGRHLIPPVRCRPFTSGALQLLAVALFCTGCALPPLCTAPGILRRTGAGRDLASGHG